MMTAMVFSDFGSGDDLLPDGTRPLPKTMLAYRHLDKKEHI